MPNVIGEVQNETADVRDSVWNIPDETKNVPNDVLDIPDLESDLPEEVLNVRDLIANVPNEVWKERLRLGLDQDFFERFAHGEMQGFPGWNIHDPASFRIFGRPWPAGADGEAAEAPDFHPAPVGQGLGDLFQNDIKSLGDILFVIFIKLPGSLADQFTLKHDGFAVSL